MEGSDRDHGGQFPGSGSSMTLFSDPQDHASHRVRMVLAEKGVSVEIVNVEPGAVREELAEINPYGSAPTLVDRELSLYQSRIIMEYLDERFPHPPLLPAYPVLRAKIRLLMHRIDRDWSPAVKLLSRGAAKGPILDKAAKDLRESIISTVPVVAEHDFFLSDEFTLVDCCVAPILWRLDALSISLPPRVKRLFHPYTNRVFQRDSFRISLTERELEMGI